MYMQVSNSRRIEAMSQEGRDMRTSMVMAICIGIDDGDDDVQYHSESPMQLNE